MTSVYPAPPPAHHKFITVRLNDISTASSAWVVPGFRGKIRNAWAVINGAITDANAVLTLKIGGSAVTGGTLTIVQSGSAAGNVSTATPSAANTFTATQAVQIETNGGSTGTVAAEITLQVEPV